MNQINCLKVNHLKRVKLTTTTKKKNMYLSHHYGDQCFNVCFKITFFSFSDSAC